MAAAHGDDLRDLSLERGRLGEAFVKPARGCGEARDTPCACKADSLGGCVVESAVGAHHRTGNHSSTSKAYVRLLTRETRVTRGAAPLQPGLLVARSLLPRMLC